MLSELYLIKAIFKKKTHANATKTKRVTRIYSKKCNAMKIPYVFTALSINLKKNCLQDMGHLTK